MARKKQGGGVEFSSRITRSAASFNVLEDLEDDLDDLPILNSGILGNKQAVAAQQGIGSTGPGTVVKDMPVDPPGNKKHSGGKTVVVPGISVKDALSKVLTGNKKIVVPVAGEDATAVSKLQTPQLPGIDADKQLEVNEKSATPTPWSALFKDNRDPRHGIKLRYVPPKGDTLDFGDRILPSMVDMWGYCLVGHFTGKFPGLKAVHDLKAKWGVKCLVRSHKKGWLIFKFQNDEDRSRVLQEGPYIVFGKLLMLKELSENFSFEDEEFLKVPIWVKFHDLPLQLWNDEAMSEVSSMVGVPITTDKITQERINNDYARVLIEVDVSKPPPLSFPIRLPSQKVFKQSVVYETFPSYCFHCKEFGHHPFICKKLSKCGVGVDKEKEKHDVVVDVIEEVGVVSARTELTEPKEKEKGGAEKEKSVVAAIQKPNSVIHPTGLPSGPTGSNDQTASQDITPHPTGLPPDPTGSTGQIATQGQRDGKKLGEETEDPDTEAKSDTTDSENQYETEEEPDQEHHVKKTIKKSRRRKGETNEKYKRRLGRMMGRKIK
ncbi:unnamed protein product [Cuscuta epithymum]|uniref:DUF4283 domain-containing protein n=1 Tax=Cuscuta epithymum TaxID=186058 RepID=A0AAV0FIX1_9ASTE|nr:unnamed protein product [Cuscuta epithymum]